MTRDERLDMLNAHRVSQGLEALVTWLGTDDALRRELDVVENEHITLRYEAGQVEVDTGGLTTQTDPASAVRRTALSLGALGSDPLVRAALAEAISEGVEISRE